LLTEVVQLLYRGNPTIGAHRIVIPYPSDYAA
jgi:hypothetical protein